MGAASAPGASASFLDQAAGDGLNIMPPSVHWSLAAIGDAQLTLDVDPTLADGRERTYPHTALYQGSRANVEYGHHQPREAM